MDEMKLQTLINMSNRYLDNNLEKHEKKSVEDISKSLFYQSLYDDLPDSELNKQIRLFAVMAQQFSKDESMSNQKLEGLKAMVDYMQNSINWPIQPRNWRVSKYLF